MKYWYDRLKELRLKKNMSQGKMARALGIDASSISRYERSKGAVDLTDNFLLRLEKFFTKEEIEYIKNGSTAKAAEDTIEDSGVVYGMKDDRVSIPYHKEVYASAGGGSYDNVNTPSPVTFSRHFLHSYLGLHNIKGLSIINAAGDSMTPTIKSGELMFVYPVENDGFKDGGIYVVMCGDALLVKRVWFDPVTKEYTLASDNPEVAAVKLGMDESSGCHFVGRVVGHMNRV